MYWHAQVTSLSLRAHLEPDFYGRKLPFLASAKAELLGDKLAYVQLASRKDGRDLTPGDWRDVARLLRDQHGIETLMFHRGNRLITMPTLRA